jgi:hypothetical protein
MFPGGLNSLELFQMIYNAVVLQDLCLSFPLQQAGMRFKPRVPHHLLG